VLKWHGFHPKGFHERVWCAFFSVRIKLFFEQFIYGFVDIERRAAGPRDLPTHIEPEAARALHVQLYF
jgi:hypothetical protein